MNSVVIVGVVLIIIMVIIFMVILSSKNIYFKNVNVNFYIDFNPVVKLFEITIGFYFAINYESIFSFLKNLKIFQ